VSSIWLYAAGLGPASSEARVALIQHFEFLPPGAFSYGSKAKSARPCCIFFTICELERT
jgi:hypothetical protein